MHRFKWLTLALCGGLVVLTTGCAKLQSRDQMNQGVQAYKNNHYAQAVKHFKEAVRLDPSNQAAQQEFERVLKKDPSNSLALASMASMAYNSAGSGTQEQRHAALEEAKKWN